MMKNTHICWVFAPNNVHDEMGRGCYNNQLLMSGDIICGGFMGASMMQPLHCLPHGLRALLELCSLTEINCLHCPLSLLQ